jgi:hypothetical protein
MSSATIPTTEKPYRSPLPAEVNNTLTGWWLAIGFMIVNLFLFVPFLHEGLDGLDLNLLLVVVGVVSAALVVLGSIVATGIVQRNPSSVGLLKGSVMAGIVLTVVGLAGVGYLLSQLQPKDGLDTMGATPMLGWVLLGSSTMLPLFFGALALSLSYVEDFQRYIARTDDESLAAAAAAERAAGAEEAEAEVEQVAEYEERYEREAEAEEEEDLAAVEQRAEDAALAAAEENAAAGALDDFEQRLASAGSSVIVASLDSQVVGGSVILADLDSRVHRSGDSMEVIVAELSRTHLQRDAGPIDPAMLQSSYTKSNVSLAEESSEIILAEISRTSLGGSRAPVSGEIIVAELASGIHVAGQSDIIVAELGGTRLAPMHRPGKSDIQLGGESKSPIRPSDTPPKSPPGTIPTVAQPPSSMEIIVAEMSSPKLKDPKATMSTTSTAGVRMTRIVNPKQTQIAPPEGVIAPMLSVPEIVVAEVTQPPRRGEPISEIIVSEPGLPKHGEPSSSNLLASESIIIAELSSVVIKSKQPHPGDSSIFSAPEARSGSSRIQSSRRLATQTRVPAEGSEPSSILDAPSSSGVNLGDPATEIIVAEVGSAIQKGAPAGPGSGKGESIFDSPSSKTGQLKLDPTASEIIVADMASTILKQTPPSDVSSILDAPASRTDQPATGIAKVVLAEPSSILASDQPSILDAPASRTDQPVTGVSEVILAEPSSVVMKASEMASILDAPASHKDLPITSVSEVITAEPSSVVVGGSQQMASVSGPASEVVQVTAETSPAAPPASAPEVSVPVPHVPMTTVTVTSTAPATPPPSRVRPSEGKPPQKIISVADPELIDLALAYMPPVKSATQAMLSDVSNALFNPTDSSTSLGIEGPASEEIIVAEVSSMILKSDQPPTPTEITAAPPITDPQRPGGSEPPPIPPIVTQQSEIKFVEVHRPPQDHWEEEQGSEEENY